MVAYTATQNFRSSDRGVRLTQLVDRLKIAIDEDRMAETLRCDWGYLRANDLVLNRCLVLRVHSQSSGEFVVVYRLEMSGPDGPAEMLLFGQLFAGNPEQKCRDIVFSLQKSRRGQLPSGTDTLRITFLRDLGMVLRAPGLDEKIAGLRLLNHPEELPEFMRRRIPKSELQTGDLSMTLLGHRLGKRCVTRILQRGGDEPEKPSVIAKFYKSNSDRGRQVFAAMQGLMQGEFGQGQNQRISAPIAYDQKLHALLMEDVRGTSLSDLDGDARNVALEATGASLARFHSQAVRVADRYGPLDEIDLLDRCVGLVRQVLPELGIADCGALEVLHGELACEGPVAARLVHRDFHEKQVLVGDTGVTLIDFDTICLGDPAIDVGNFLAHLRFDGLRSVTGSHLSEDIFLRGYLRHAPDGVVERSATYLRATLLRLACIHAFSRAGRGVVPALLEEILHGGMSDGFH